jgi:DNA-binding beta-propeller fold protein YncE
MDGSVTVTSLRPTLALLAASVSLLVLPAGAGAVVGELTQLAGTAGCISETGTSGTCVDGKALDEPRAVAVADVGGSITSRVVYIAAHDSDAIAVFSRNEATGQLTQLPGTAGCVSETGSGGQCADGKALNGPSSLAVKGNRLLVASELSHAVAVFERDSTTGALTQLPGEDGCVSNDGTGGECEDGKALASPKSVAVATNGANAYVASAGSGAVAAFSFASELTQLPGEDGCVSESGGGGCADGRALNSAQGVTVAFSEVYVAGAGGVAAFSREVPGDGSLTQFPGTKGCFSETGTGGQCTQARGLDGPRTLTTPSINDFWENVYVNSAHTADTSALAVFARDHDTGELTQLPGLDGCVSDTGVGGDCFDGRVLNSPWHSVVSPESRSVYSAITTGAVAAFARNNDTGALTQLPGKAGCISETGNGGECRDGKALNVGQGGVAISNDGEHVYVASNASDAVAVFDRKEDTTPPNTTITSGLANGAATFFPSVTFEFASNESDVLFSCRTDDQSAFQPCTSPHTVSGLAVGSHTFRVRARDPFGNTDPTPATRTFTRVPLYVPPGGIDVGTGDSGTATIMPPPDNAFSLGELDGKKLSVTVPGPGEVEVADAADQNSRWAAAAKRRKLLKPSSATSAAAGTITVKLKLTRTAKKALKRNGKVKVKAAITFTPTGGTANTEIERLKVRQ